MVNRCFVLVFAMLILCVAAGWAQDSLDLSGDWKFQTDPGDVGLQKGWLSPGFDDSKWRGIKVPGSWESQGVTQVNPTWNQADDLNQPYTGYAWYRKSVVIPAGWKGKNLRLRLGRIDDLDWTYLNGKQIGKTAERGDMVSAIARSYSIPEGVIKFGQPNVIAVRVLDYRGLGGIMDGPVAVQVQDSSATSGGGTRVDASGDSVNVSGDVQVAAGQIVKDAVAINGDVGVYGHVTGDAVAVMGDVHVYEGGRIDGDATAVCGKVDKEPNSTVGGQVTSIAGPRVRLPWGRPYFEFLPRLSVMLLGFAVGLLFSLVHVVIVALFPQRMETIARVSTEKAGWSVLYGILAWLLILPVALVLLITCIGIPLILVEILLAFVGLIVGKAGIALAVGWKLGEAVKKPIASSVLAVFIGGLAIAFLELVPCLGSLVSLVLSLIGFGAVWITGFGAKPDWIWTRGKNGTTTEG